MMVESVKDIQKICLVGLDPVGGSLSLGFSRSGYKGKVFAVDEAPKLKKAWEKGVIQDGSSDLAMGLTGAQMVVLSNTGEDLKTRLTDVWTKADPDTIIVDLSYMKGYVNSVYDEVGREDIHYVGIRLVEHISPIADCGYPGPFYFDDRTVILTPRDSEDLDAYSLLAAAFENIGAHVIAMSPMAHDRQIADFVHLPRVVRLALVEYAYSTTDGKDLRADVMGSDLLEKLQTLQDLYHSTWSVEVEALRDVVCRSLDECITRLKDVRADLVSGKIEERLHRLLETASSTLEYAGISETPKLVVVAGDNISILERVSKLLAESHLTIENIERTHNCDGTSFKLTMPGMNEREQAVNLLKTAGIETFSI